MAGLAKIIQFLHPTAVSLQDFKVFSYQGVESITLWNQEVLGARPSIETLLQSSAAADAADAAVPVPAEVGSGQIRAAMIELEYAADDSALDTLIEGAIVAAVPAGKERQKALTLWRNASTFKRTHPFISVVKAVLAKSDADIDALFILAASF